MAAKGGGIKSVAVNRVNYAVRRNICGSPVPGYRTRPTRNLYRLAAGAYRRLRGRQHVIWFNSYKSLPGTRYDLLHLFNGISHDRAPWVSTFETYLPRFQRPDEKALVRGVRALASGHCKRLIALSQCAIDIQRDHLQPFPEESESIGDKLTVLHPPQAALIEDYAEKPLSAAFLDLAMVGRQFFVKGGMELLVALDHMIRLGAPLRLHIVSAMSTEGIAPRRGRALLERANAIIADHPRHIRHDHWLPNRKVLALLKRSHVVLLPSWADTYGYTVLEGQAAGCATISSNVRALPELNPASVGWTVELPLTRLGYPKVWPGTRAANPVSDQLTLGLVDALTDALNRPGRVAAMGARALTRIREAHCPRRHAARLGEIYDEALG